MVTGDVVHLVYMDSMILRNNFLALNKVVE